MTALRWSDLRPGGERAVLWRLAADLTADQSGAGRALYRRPGGSGLGQPFDGLHSYNPIGRIAGGASPQSLFDAIVWEAESMGKISAVGAARLRRHGYRDGPTRSPFPAATALSTTSCGRRRSPLCRSGWSLRRLTSGTRALKSSPVSITATITSDGPLSGPICFARCRSARFGSRSVRCPKWSGPGSGAHRRQLRRIVPGEVDVTWDLPSGWTYEGGRPVALGPTVIVSVIWWCRVG